MKKKVLDVVDVMDKLQNLTEIGKSNKDKQSLINVSDVFYIWDILVVKYDIMETIHIFDNFIEDKDLKIIQDHVVVGIQKGIIDMEKLMADYDLPFPVRPPAGSNSTVSLEDVTDRDIYQTIFEAVQAFFPVLANGFMNSTSPKIRKSFKIHLLDTIERYEVVVEYGKLKGFINEPPVYRV